MNGRVDTMRAIEAPEGVELSLRVAGPLPRALAYLIDLLVRFTVWAAIAGLLGWVAGIGQAAALLLFFALEWFYPVCCEVWMAGATPGKRLLGLAALCDDGRPIGWSESLLRNFLRGADILPFGYAVGLVSALVSPEFKRLGDRVAGTVVVHVDEPSRGRQMPEAQPVAPPVPLASEEQAAIVDFAARIPGWSRPRAIEIADQLEPLTGERGEAGVARALALASWIQGAR